MESIRPRPRRESSIAQAIRLTLESHGWLVVTTSAPVPMLSQTAGLPDLMCWGALPGAPGEHSLLPTLRWLEVKRPRPHGALTEDQARRFAEFESHGLGVWVACSPLGVLDLLKRPPNWRDWPVRKSSRQAKAEKKWIG